ncbi:hypothetical protein [Kribbella monticola]|uniref:hypothetical protein n=1 Tax=Kribbella monticola TaxID=2185285 RepID=UPI000DD49042|nr:hypothetical protein [Kribbella monticola]
MKLYRPATVLVGVLFVLLGGLTRLVDTDQVYEDSTRVTAHGTIGQKIQYGDSAVTVTRMRFAKTFLADENDDKPIETDGIFVAVEYEAYRGTKDPGSNDVTLTADDGNIYESVAENASSGITFPQPGFTESGAFVFEVNTNDLKGLTFKLRTSQFFTGVPARDIAVDLAVPSDEVAKQLVDKAADQYVMPERSTRVDS